MQQVRDTMGTQRPEIGLTWSASNSTALIENNSTREKTREFSCQTDPPHISTQEKNKLEIRKLESVIDEALDKMHVSFRMAPNNSNQQNEVCPFDLDVEALFSTRPTLLSV